MDCERFDKITLELLYGELDELSAAAARRHLHHCTRCQGIYSKLRATKEVAVLPLEEVPADLFESILEGERSARSRLPVRQRVSHWVSVVAGYAMRPQLAMAALLLLMIGSSLLFVRQVPADRDQVSVTELGAPRAAPAPPTIRAEPVLVEGEAALEAMEKKAAGAENRSADAGPPASYAEALTAYQEGRYAEAERLFAEVAARGGEKAGTAALHEGHAARNGAGCQRAARIYDAVAQKYAGTTLAEEASWHAASCYQALGELGRARAHYVALKGSQAFSDRAGAALEAIDETLNSEGETTAAAVASRAAAAASTPAALPAAESSGVASRKATSATAAGPSDAAAPAASSDSARSSGARAEPAGPPAKASPAKPTAPKSGAHSP